MPKNRFPDTREKRELRRRDARRLRSICERFAKKFAYCGLPSVEFLDIEAWKDSICSVTGFEDDPEACADMLIERDRRNYCFPVTINPGGVRDIVQFLCSGNYCFDLYNLDFYGGLVYPTKKGGYRSTDAIRRVFAEQANCGRSFALIATFNVRDRGAGKYARFLESAKQGLVGRKNATENIRRHEINQSTRLKLCFPFFCWQQAHASGFEQTCDDVVFYKSSATMVHFFQLFNFKGVRLPPVPPAGTLIDMANRPLYVLEGQIRRIAVAFPEIG